METALIVISTTLVCTFLLVLSIIATLDRIHSVMLEILNYMYESTSTITYEISHVNEQRSDNENDNS